MRRTGFLLLTLALWAASTGAQLTNGSPPGGPIAAAPLPVDGTWVPFCWSMGVGSLNDEGPFTFMGPATLDVTDLFLDGDRFDVLDGGTSIGMTSVPTDSGASIGDPDTAFADPRFSSGSFALGAGSHSITFEVTAVPMGFPNGCGRLRAVSAVPAAPAWALAALVVALIGVGTFLLRRRLAG